MAQADRWDGVTQGLQTAVAARTCRHDSVLKSPPPTANQASDTILHGHDLISAYTLCFDSICLTISQPPIPVQPESVRIEIGRWKTWAPEFTAYLVFSITARVSATSCPHHPSRANVDCLVLEYLTMIAGIIAAGVAWTLYARGDSCHD